MMAQPVVKVNVSSDTIELGATVEVTYTIENGEGQFVMPVMDNLPVVSGPNSSSSFMYQDGKMRSSQSYSFTLLALEEGKIIVPEAAYKTGNEKMVINPVEIIVMREKQKSESSKKNQETTKPTVTREKKKI
jgi:oxygen tolerance protein BatD